MKQFLLISLLGFSLLVSEKLKVVTSIPGLAWMAERIGGEHVRVISLATGKEDMHAVPVKPSFLPKLYRADLLITLGLDAEHAWLPALVRESRNPKINPGQSGWINCSEGIEPLDVPQKITRLEGEQHPHGNPHINLSPQNGLLIASNVFLALNKELPQKTTELTENFFSLQTEIKECVSICRRWGKKLQGKKLISYHADMAYLCQFYGIEQVGEIEKKPGVPPTPRHLKKIIEKGGQEKVTFVLSSQGQNTKLSQKVAKAIGVPHLTIVNLTGGNEECRTWVDLQYFILDRLLSVLKEN